MLDDICLAGLPLSADHVTKILCKSGDQGVYPETIRDDLLGTDTEPHVCQSRALWQQMQLPRHGPEPDTNTHAFYCVAKEESCACLPG